MWAGTAYCGPVAFNVVPVADNVGQTTGLFANNVVRKWGVIVGPSESYCGPLHLDGNRPFSKFLKENNRILEATTVNATLYYDP
jgi:hypothetical protein